MGVDCIGKMRHTSIVGNHAYCMVFVDRVNNNTRVYPMKSLFDVTKALDEHMGWVKNTPPQGVRKRALRP